MNFKKTTLPNGLRVITVPVADNPSVMVMVMVETGSNYETKGENGLSHFLEHMCFKGTANRPKANDIAKELDALGAQNNAFTSNEFTGYYARASKKHFSKLFEIISDLYLNPTLPSEELEKEKGVILEEISMNEDKPRRKVDYILNTLMYGDTPAGRTILGPRENIKKFKRRDFINYRNKHYVASSSIVVVAGDVGEERVLAEVKKHFSNISRSRKVSKLPVKEKQTSPRLGIFHKDTDQTHMIMAFRTHKANDKRIPALLILAGILGKGMSSRLFNKLREEMGACYYIGAGNDQYTDHGVFSIATGINASRTKEVIRAILDECKKLTKTPVSKEELEKVKEHRIGNLYMGIETTDAIAEFYAMQEIINKKMRKPQELEKLLRAVTAKDVLMVARDIFKNNNLNLAIVGKVADKQGIKKVLSFK